MAVQLVIGNSLHSRPNGDSWGFLFNDSLWGKGSGFFLSMIRVEGCLKYRSGLRVFRGSGSGLRVRSPDDHVMLLIPLYLTGVFSLFTFPHPLLLSHH